MHWTRATLKSNGDDHDEDQGDHAQEPTADDHEDQGEDAQEPNADDHEDQGEDAQEPTADGHEDQRDSTTRDAPTGGMRTRKQSMHV